MKAEPQKVPRYLYKYFPASRWESLFIDWKIRFTPPEDFNDPFECMPFTQKLGEFPDLEVIVQNPTAFLNGLMLSPGYEELRKYFPEDEAPEEKLLDAILTNVEYFAALYNDMQDSPEVIQACRLCLRLMIDKFRKMYGVLSLSAQKDNLLLWSHYADSHKGFVVQFDTSHTFFKKKADGEPAVYKVQYIKERAKESMRDIDQKVFFEKPYCWNYEKEFRMVKELTPDSGLSDLSKIYSVPLSSTLFTLPAGTISSIIFGANAPLESVRNRCKNLEQQEGCSHIKFLHARFHEEKYKLVFLTFSDVVLPW